MQNPGEISEIENSFEALDCLCDEAIEQYNQIQPIEITVDSFSVEPLSFETNDIPVRGGSVSFRGGNCPCSCDMSCTRGY